MSAKTLLKIERNELSRAELTKLIENATPLALKGNADAKAILDAVAASGVHSSDREFAFIGFCPGGKIENRLDKKWIDEGICAFDFTGSPHQHERFRKIMAGDTVILKKREKFGETMMLYRHGTVNRTLEPGRVLQVKWSEECQPIEVPLMGCNSSVDIKDISTVESSMPDEFWQWIKMV